MNATITRHRARLPGDVNGPLVPAIFVQPAMDGDYAKAGIDDPDCSLLKSAIYHFTPAGKRIAERIARELQTSGVAVIYPFDQGIQVYVGVKHCVTDLAARVTVKGWELW